MSRSRRFPTYYVCMGANPEAGKRSTSRLLRRKVRHICHDSCRTTDFVETDVYLDHPQDKIRGSAGSRSEDQGWHYFGDGRRRIFNRRLKPREHLVCVQHTRNTRELAEVLRRK